jgi:hypothetical protein
MAFFGLNESEQKNITENSISNSVRNSSSNISRNNIVSSQDTSSSVEVDIIDSTILCPYDISSVAKSVMNQDIQVLSETHTSYDTSLTNNVTNTLKNAVKQKTPGLYQAGLFSSQVNNQLNKAVNSTKNNVSNSFYKNRKNLVSNDQSTTADVKLNITRSTIKCSDDDDRNVVESNATSFLQNKFLSQSLDEESAKTSISTTFRNNLSNVASQTGGSILGGVITIIVFVIIILGALKMGAFEDSMDGSKKGRNLKIFSLHPKLKLLIIVIGLIAVSYYCIQILRDKNNYEIDENSSGECDTDAGYVLSDSFKNDQERIDKCLEKTKKLKDWKELRSQDNFSSTNISNEVSGESQYPRVSSSISHRGVHRERGSDGTFFDVDYTRLNIDPYSDYDCGEEGNVPNICRSIEEDFKWEELIKKSCGCCNCDPENIGYMKEWLEHNQGKECFLNNKRELGVFCDKNIDIIQPGSGYEIGQDYNTTCKNPKNDSRPGAGDGLCKKRNADGTLSDILDSDLGSSIVVNLISETDCRGLSGDLMDNPMSGGCNNNDGADVDSNGRSNMGCCYQKAPSEGVWDNIMSSLFGDNTGELCTGEQGTFDSVTGICPGDCMKADSCRINYLNALRQEKSNAISEDRDINSVKTPGCLEGCEYIIKGVQELRVKEVPPNHIEDPDNIYTIAHKDAGDMKPVEYNDGDGGFQNTSIDSVWQASSFIHFTNAPTSYTTGFIKHDSCNEIADGKAFTKYNNLGTPNNLCECKFRRLPSCIKNKDGDTYSSEMGCEDDIDLDADCMVCENTASGVKMPPNYGNKLKDKSLNKIGGVLVGYISLCILLFIFF